ncbi:BLUF domain-containing protein [Mesobacterium pallidum]|uniref:BLUF domain-containing protein n=1 Tax=Mesobacterium pallidum TaxID=2872037 RepID=UPI001EE2EA5B|nr:BLUF domain-containing protein [Mesobacterium pallidum]
MSLCRLLYISSAVRDFDTEEVQVLAANARARNAANDLTGLLIYHDGSFLQVLEGPSEAVQASYARISHNWRHKNPTVLLREEVADRVFPEFSMACADPGKFDDDMQGMLQHLSQLKQDGPRMSAPDMKVKVLIRSFLNSFTDLPVETVEG